MTKPDCFNCPLNGGPKVEPRLPRGRKIAIVGEAPGEQETYENQFFVGQSGHYLNHGLRIAGRSRDDVLITNACLCKPQKKELAPEEWKAAITACAPRLEKDLRGITHVLALGKRAWHALTPYRDALFPWVGAPQVFNGRTVVPSMHPAYCLRGQRQYLPVLYTFIQRVFDQHDRRNLFTWQPLSYLGGGPDPIGALEGILKRGALLGIDIETAGKDPLVAGITALGVADTHCGVSLLWPPTRHFERRSDAQLATRLIKDILRSQAPKVCHNGSHDITGLRRAGFAINNYAHDTILIHHVVGNLLRHDLGFVSQVEFACDPWKKWFKVTGDAKGLARFLTAKGEELTLYNAKDTGILPRLVPVLMERLKHEHNGAELYAGYFKRAEIAARMRLRGLRKNRDAILKHRRRLSPTIGRAEKAVVKTAMKFKKSWGPKSRKDKTFSVQALDDLRELFFVHLNQTPMARTAKTGAGKLDAKTLEAFCVAPNPEVRDMARKVLIYRQNSKLRNTYLRPLLGPEETVHPTPKVWGTKTGRWSYSDPAINTAPSEMRDCFQAAEGNWIVEADYSQLELRIVALLAGDEEMLQWYRDGVDVHTKNAQGLFSTTEPTKKQRDLAKRLVYGMNYGGEAGTIWTNLVPHFPSLTLTDVSRAMRNWRLRRKAITRWQSQLLKAARRNDYVEAPLSGRREYFFGQPEMTKIYNYPIQASAADIIDAALAPLWHSLRQIKSWILVQVHDSLVCETPYPRECARRMQRHMAKAVTLNGHKAVFPVDFKIARGWGNQTQYERWEDIPE